MPTDDPLSGGVDTAGRPPHLGEQYPRTASLDEDARHRLLSSARRRTLLTALETLSAPVTLSQLATVVAANEIGDDGAEVTTDLEEVAANVAVSLHHVHLPLMADLSLIDYDSEANRIEL